MIIRNHYRACLKEEYASSDRRALRKKEDAEAAGAAVRDGRCLTVALYRHQDMLFLYYEALDPDLKPQELFPVLSEQLSLWPEKDGRTPWAFMYHIYWHSVPETPEQWAREGKKERRGRIAYLLPEKLFSYVYYHKAIVDEGLLEGDRYQSIALHENVLFSYFEEPKIFTHIREEYTGEASKVIDEWLAADPESHFDHSLSGEANFLLIGEVFSMGREDFQYGTGV